MNFLARLIDKKIWASAGVLLFVSALFYLYGNGFSLAYVLILALLALLGTAAFLVFDPSGILLLGVLLLGTFSYGQKVANAVLILFVFLLAGCGWTVASFPWEYKNKNLLRFCGAALAIWFEALVLSGNHFDSMILMHHVCALLLVIFVATNENVTVSKLLILAKIYLAFLCVWGVCEVAFFPKERIEGPHFSATAFGETLACFFAILVASLVFQKKRIGLIDVVLGIGALFSILMTGTRFALVSAVAIFFLLAPFHPSLSKKKKLLLQLLVVALVAISMSALWSLLPSTLKIKQTFAALDVAHKQIDGSSLGRILAWWVVYKTLPAHPWMGVGIGQFPELFLKQVPLMRLVHAHNVFVNTVAEIGLIGLFLLLLMILTLALSVLAKKDKQEAAIYWCLGVVVLMLGQTDNVPLYPTMVFWAALLCGMALK